MQHNPPLKLASKNDLVDFIQFHILQDTLRPGFNWRDKLRLAGYQPIFQNIDFNEILSLFALQATRWIDINSLWHGITFNQCKNIPVLEACILYQCIFNDCHFLGLNRCGLTQCKITGRFHSARIHKCEFIDCEITHSEFSGCMLSKLKFHNTLVSGNHFHHSTLVRVEGLKIQEYSLNQVDKSTNLINTSWEIVHYDKHFSQNLDEGKEPVIVMVYMPEHGTEMTDKLALYLQKQFVNLVLIHPESGFNHPVLKNGNVDGFILPGGPDVPTDNSEMRTAFEIAIIKHAKANDIPVLGICRGHQIIGYQLFNARIRSVDDHLDRTNTIFINPDSQLHQHLEKKYTQFNAKKSWQSNPLTMQFGMFYFNGAPCFHNNAVEITEEAFNKNVIARTQDGTVEGLQSGNFITFQHHHEAILGRKDAAGKIARSNIKEFVSKTKQHRGQRQNRETFPCKL